jgi:hypothetical protein
MENQGTKRITTPEEAINALAIAAHTARQTFCIDEPPLPTLLCELTWCAEEIAEINGCPESVMDGYYRTVFSEHPTDVSPLTARELQAAQTALLNYVCVIQDGDPSDRLREGIARWNDLLQAVEDAKTA